MAMVIWTMMVVMLLLLLLFDLFVYHLSKRNKQNLAASGNCSNVSVKYIFNFESIDATIVSKFGSRVVAVSDK